MPRAPFLGRLFFAFMLANVIFLLVVLVSFSVSYANYRGVSSMTSTVLDELAKMDVLLEGSAGVCEDDTLLEASEILDRVGGKISILETRFGKNDERVLEQKTLYTELEMKHFELIKRMDSLCGRDSLTVLFFYSNEEEVEEESDRAGFVLSSFKKTEPERIMVYSFDANLDSELVRGMREKYGITSAPLVVVNEEDVFYLRNIKELEKYLNL